MESFPFTERAQLGIPTCDSGKKLRHARFFYTGETDFSVEKMLDENEDYSLKQGIEPQPGVEINVNNFYIKLQTGEKLLPKGLLGKGGYGSVYKFEDDSGTISAAVKFMFVEVGVTNLAFAQSSFDMRWNYKQISEIQSAMDCPVIFSIHFTSPKTELDGKTLRLEITIMEEAQKTLRSYLNTHFSVPSGQKPHALLVLRQILESIIDNFLCITQHNTIFPDIKVENMAISCNPNETQVLFIDVDGLLTLRSRDGQSSFPRFGKTPRERGRMPVTTYAPYELAVDGAYPLYTETRAILLSYYAFLVTLLDIICIMCTRTHRIDPNRYREGPQGLRGMRAKDGYTKILDPAMTACFAEISGYRNNPNADAILQLLQVMGMDLEWLAKNEKIITLETDPQEMFEIVEKTARLCKRRISTGFESMDTTTRFKSNIS